jgi:hypothetical protein
MSSSSLSIRSFLRPRSARRVTKVKILLLAVVVMICLWVMAYPADAATPGAGTFTVTVSPKSWTAEQAFRSPGLWQAPHVVYASLVSVARS